MTDDQAPDPEIATARHEVELARAELEVRLRDVGRVGSRIWARAGRRARPILIGGAVAVGALLLLRAVRSGSRTRRTGGSSPSRGPSLLRMAVGSALGIVFRGFATALVRRSLERREATDSSYQLGPGIFDGGSTPSQRND